MESLITLVALPVGLGLLGFIEPCTIGSSLLFLHYLEGRTAREKITQTIVFTASRALLMGLLGIVAVLVGARFVDLQKGAWALLGVIYVLLGLAYLTGHADRLKRSVGVGLGRLQGARGASALGLLFAFNIPACAGPLLAVLLGTAAVSQASSATRGFVMLGLFGLALSLPIAVAACSERGRALFQRIATCSREAPRIIGIVFIVLGVWSIRFALVAEVL